MSARDLVQQVVSPIEQQALSLIEQRIRFWDTQPRDLEREFCRREVMSLHARIDSLVRSATKPAGEAALQPGLVQALEDVVCYLTDSWRKQARVLEREKEQQVCAQNFEAASNIRDELRALESHWSREALLARVLNALGRTP